MSKEKFSKGKSMDDVPVSAGRGADRPRPGDLVDVFKIPEKWARLRFFGPIFSYGGHWVKTKTRDGKLTQFFVTCLAYDSEEGKRDSTKKCPWCNHKEGPRAQGEKPEVNFTTNFWSNAIVRSLQKNKPENVPKPTRAETESGFKDKESESWTPVRAISTSANLMKTLKDLKSLNVHENTEGESIGYPISHAKFGCDIMLKQDEKAPPAQRYQNQKGDHKPLTKEEKTYLIYDLSELQEPAPLDEAESEYKKWFERMHPEAAVKKHRDADEDDEDDMPKAKSKRRSIDDDEDDELPVAKKRKLVDEDDEDDEPPKKSAKKRVVDDDDEDDEPPAKKKPAAKKKVVDEDEDDEDDEPPAKSKKKPAPKSDWDDEDDEDDEPPAKKKVTKKAPVDDEDDEDDEPPVKKKAPAKKRVVDDDDEDDEPPVKKKAPVKRKPVDEDDEDDEPPVRKKKKVVDEDDDEEL